MRLSMMRSRFAVAGAALAAAAAVSLAATAARAEPFYDAAPAELPGRPGTIIRSEPFPGAPGGASAHRVLYRSTNASGQAIAVSGVVIVPGAPAPEGGRAIVAWAHPTTGVVQRCAPSLRRKIFQTIPGLDDLIARGFVVAATDYPGLGTAGPHPYLVGQSEGRAVLDSVRAARALPGVSAGTRFAVWGHSQGGHAAVFSGELAQSYAPELALAGVAAAAPATRLAELFEDDLDTVPGRILTAMALYSWSRVFDLPLDGLVERAALPAFERTAELCGESVFEAFLLRLAARPLRRGFLEAEPAKTEPWRSIMARNTPDKMLSGVPLFLAQGTKDTVVLPRVTSAYRADLCRKGVRVKFDEMPGVIHATAARASASAAVAWMAERLAGAPAPSDCASR